MIVQGGSFYTGFTYMVNIIYEFPNSYDEIQIIFNFLLTNSSFKQMILFPYTFISKLILTALKPI